VQQDRLDSLDHQVPQEVKDQPDLWANEGRTDQLEAREQLEAPDQLESWVLLGTQVALVHRVHKVPGDLMEQLDSREPLELLGPRASLAASEQPAPKEQLENPVHKELPVPLVSLDQRVLLV
jgi:hypothetical protein